MLNKNQIKEKVDQALLDAYSEMMKDEPKENKFVNIYWNLIESVYSNVLSYIRKNSPETKKMHLDVKDLLYDDLDEQRISQYFEEFQTQENSLEARHTFLNKLSKIYITEVGLIRDRTFLEAARFLIEVYHYDVSITYESSICGEIGGVESEEVISTRRLSLADIEALYDDEVICSHPNCPGHLLDIDVDHESVEKIEVPIEKGL